MINIWRLLLAIPILVTATLVSFASCGYIRSDNHYSAEPVASSPHKTGEKKFQLEANGSLTNRNYYRDEVMVLMYHNVEVKSDHVGILTVSKLDKHLSAIKKNGFHIITMEEYLDFALHEKSVPNNAVLITFDDGYETFYTNVFPLLRKYGMTATNFIVVSSIENPRQIGRKKLTWNQMREMKKEGMSFYSHTYASHDFASVDHKGKKSRPLLSHRIYLKRFNRMETEHEYEQRILNDLSKAEIRLKEKLGNSQSVLAFPYGAYSDTDLKMARKLGIEVTFTIHPGINIRSQRIVYRINAGNQRLKTTDLIQYLKRGGKRNV